MLGSVFGKSLRDQRWAMLGWIVAVLLLLGWVMGLWPTIRDASADLARLFQNMPPALQAMLGDADFTTARGFLSAQLFGVMLPVLTAILAIGRGSGIIAGEEERGELQLVVARPLSRARIFLEKTAATFIAIGVFALAVFVLALIGTRIMGMDVTAGELGGGAAGLALLGVLLAAIALAVGGATGSRGAALAGTAAAAVIFYLAAIFGRMVEGLAWLADISPWQWSFGGNPLGDGPSLASAAAVVVLAAIALAVGLWRFQRRDLR